MVNHWWGIWWSSFFGKGRVGI